MTNEGSTDLVRRYLRQQREFGYPDPILTAPERTEAPAHTAAPTDAPAPTAPTQTAVPAPTVAPPDPADVAALDSIRAELGECNRCDLHERRKKLVFGCGNPKADLMFIGEAPGADEDRIGDPFVGRAGQLLDRIFAAAGIAREEVYITNVIKCRPPGNRDPEAEEIVSCLPYLRRQIETIDPKIICALGRFASQTLLGRPESIGRLRGVWYDWEGRRLICTYHPSACLHNTQYKRPVWDDFQTLRDAYRALGPS